VPGIFLSAAPHSGYRAPAPTSQPGHRATQIAPSAGSVVHGIVPATITGGRTSRLERRARAAGVPPKGHRTLRAPAI
jgi:hypothetical protein